MSREQVGIAELLLLLDSSELQEAEQVRAAVNQQLSSDRGGGVLSSLVDFYLDTSSSQALQLLSTVREPHHKPLLDKLNEVVSRPASRLAAITLLGHMIRKQPPWVHHISHSPLLTSLLRCLKTDSDVVVLITGILVLITLLPMIPQAGKQHIYDFFDVFGRLASWSLKNPGHAAVVQLVHLQAGVYALFHRLYGMFPCNFMSYLRLHYSMKENLDTFQEVIKPMLDHVRVHPELVTGTQDYELDPSRWRCHEVHDIVIECSRVSLDPLESSCDDVMSGSSSFLPHLDLICSTEAGSSVLPPSSGCPTLSLPGLTNTKSYLQADDVTWSPSSDCGLSTPPLDPVAVSPTHPLSQTTSTSGSKHPSSTPVTSTQTTCKNQDGGLAPHNNSQVKQQPMTDSKRDQKSSNNTAVSAGVEAAEHQRPSSSSSSSSPLDLLISTRAQDDASSGPSLPPSCSFSLSFAPPNVSLTPDGPQEGGPVPHYTPMFELALPHTALLFLGKKTQEVLEGVMRQKERGGGGREQWETEQTSISPLKVLDQLIMHGHNAHEGLSRRSSAVSKMADRSHPGGKQQSMKGPAQEEELQILRSQLLLVHSQLQYERFKRQQHAIRNRRLFRRVINATALEEQSVAMRAQLGVQDQEICSLRSSLEEEQRRYTEVQREARTHTSELDTHIQQLLLQQQEQQTHTQRLQSELQECHSRLRDVEAELQKANIKANNAEHQLTQLSLKLCSSEQLQQQIFLLNQQLVLLRGTNRTLVELLEARDPGSSTEETMLQCIVGREYQRLKDVELQQRQKLEAANHRAVELEVQLARKDQLILDQKKLLDDAKAQSSADLAACESRCVALRRITQTLQSEMLQLYSQIHLDTPPDSHAPSQPQNACTSGGAALPVAEGSHTHHLPLSAVGIQNGGMEPLSTSPLLLSSSPLSPINSPLAVGSFLEQRARQLFRQTNHSEEKEAGQEEVEQQEDVQSRSPLLVQEAEEVSLLVGCPPMEPLHQVPLTSDVPAPSDLTPAVRQSRHELSIMDYNETLPEF
ncbi:TSC complex subunit 1a [Aulostomus maculatus]